MKLIILQGPPCSGKSTWATDYVKNTTNTIIVNRDSIRLDIGRGKYTLEHEEEVSKRELQYMNYAAYNGFDIISDNTNLNKKALSKLEKWAAENGYAVEYKTFYVTYEEAYTRSKARKAAGGIFISKDTLNKFYRKYYPEELKKEMTDPKIADLASHPYDIHKQQAVIVDIDGTVALHDGRSPFEWDLLDTDIADSRVFDMLNNLQHSGVKLIFLTGRPEKVRESTTAWLYKYLEKPNDCTLLMRPNNDFSHGYEYKRKMYREHIAPHFNVMCAFEDSQRCIDMWRSEGVLCMAVANNNY